VCTVPLNYTPNPRVLFLQDSVLGCDMKSKKMTGCEAQMWRLQGSLIEASPPTLTPQHQLCITDNCRTPLGGSGMPLNESCLKTNSLVEKRPN
ncbi:mCG145507, partial [Mus musculus]